MNGTPEIIVCEESPRDFELLETSLDREHISRKTRWARDRDSFMGLLESAQPELILSEARFSGWDAGQVLKEAHAVRETAPLIFVTNPDNEKVALASLEDGAADYVLKPRLNRLGSSVRRVLREAIGNQAQESMADRLCEQEGFYTSLVENMPFHLYRKDLEGRFTFVNQRFCQLVKRSAADIIGRSDFDLFPPGLARKYQEDDFRVVQSRKVFETVEENRLPGGTTRFMKVMKVPLLDANGRLRGTQGVFWDVTEQKLAHDTTRWQAGLLEKVKDAIVVCTPEGTIRHWNAAAEKLYGHAAEESVGQRVTDMLGLDHQLFLEVWNRLIDEGEWEGEFWNRTKEGRTLDIHSRCSITRDRHGQVEALIMVNSDVTEARRVASELTTLKINQGRTLLSRSIAHDLKAVLSPVWVGLGVLRALNTSRQSSAKEFDETMTAMEQSVEMGSALLQKLSLGQETADRKPLDLRQLILDFTAYLGRIFPDTCRLECVMNEKLHPVMGDATQLRQVLLNLAINARDAMATGGTLKFTARNVHISETFSARNKQGQPGEYVVMSVADTGPGIPAEIQDKVFRPYFTTKQPGQGTGLGLSTVSRIVYEHGGFIQWQAETNEGTVFHLYLPALAEQKHADGGNPVVSESRPRVLVVDDAPDVLALASAILRHANYEACIARNGTEALQLVMEDPTAIDLLVTDLKMPGMDGIELLRELQVRHLELPTVVMTGYDASNEFGELSGQLRIKYFLPKPFSQNDFLLKVSEAMAARVMA